MFSEEFNFIVGCPMKLEIKDSSGPKIIKVESCKTESVWKFESPTSQHAWCGPIQNEVTLIDEMISL